MIVIVSLSPRLPFLSASLLMLCLSTVIADCSAPAVMAKAGYCYCDHGDDAEGQQAED